MLSDDQSLQIFSEIVSKLEATANANQGVMLTLAEMKTALLKLNENQLALQQSSEEILLTAQRAEDRARKAESSWQKAEIKIDAFSQEVGKNNVAFIQSVARFNQLELEWDSRSKEWEYRLRNIEESSLPSLHETIDCAVSEVDKKIQSLATEIKEKYLTNEKYKDDLQEGQIADKDKRIQKYENTFDQLRNLLKRGGGWAWGFIGAIIVLVKNQIPWKELWDWIVDSLF